MRRFFNLVFGALALIAVALLSAFLTMRLAIHGREVEVPDLAGLTVSEAMDQVARAGLNVSLENRFYSIVTPSGRVLSQSPSPGAKVRRDWTVRITESLGPQKVSVPNVIGQTERTASVTIRRLSLDLGTVAYIPAPGPPGIVLTQTPTPAAAGIDGPRISLLVSEPEFSPHHRNLSLIPPPDPAPASPAPANPDPASPVPAAGAATAAAPAKPPPAPPSPAQAAIPSAPVATAAPAAEDEGPPSPAYVMPNLIGLSLSAASARVGALGMRINSIEAAPTPIRPVGAIPSPTAPGTTNANGSPAAPKPLSPLAPITLSNTVIAQSPAPGHRVQKGDPIHVTLGH